VPAGVATPRFRHLSHYIALYRVRRGAQENWLKVVPNWNKLAVLWITFFERVGSGLLVVVGSRPWAFVTAVVFFLLGMGEFYPMVWGLFPTYSLLNKLCRFRLIHRQLNFMNP
jgi:hypothetical protein